jgi:hypothetical protein
MRSVDTLSFFAKNVRQSTDNTLHDSWAQTACRSSGHTSLPSVGRILPLHTYCCGTLPNCYVLYQMGVWMLCGFVLWARQEGLRERAGARILHLREQLLALCGVVEGCVFYGDRGCRLPHRWLACRVCVCMVVQPAR